jgi:1,5-anhydro-D-fructose reductase (1,5-anhydro-D-mannitol-forming)
MVRVGLLSWWHVHANDYAKDADMHPNAELVAAWDEDKERGQAEAQKRGLKWYDNLTDLLNAPDIDAVIVTTPTNMHREVMLAAAQAGKHIYTEKVLAATLKDAQDIIAATEQHNVKLIVSLPRLYTRYTQTIQQLVREGALGTLTSLRVRHSHDGSLASATHPNGRLPQHFYDPVTAQGGALLDLGCHPIYLNRLFLGMPISLNATFGYFNERALEDNAVVTLKYANGVIGVAETTLTNLYTFWVELHGTNGSVRFAEPENTLWVRTRAENTWQVHEMPPADPPSAFEQWITHIEQGTTATENIAIARDLTQLMEAAYLSAGSERSITL